MTRTGDQEGSAGPAAPVVGYERPLGHANVGFFLQTYAHVLKNDDRVAAEPAAWFLSDPTGTTVHKMVRRPEFTNSFTKA
jgi:hypothetical protein